MSSLKGAGSVGIGSISAASKPTPSVVVVTPSDTANASTGSVVVVSARVVDGAEVGTGLVVDVEDDVLEEVPTVVVVRIVVDEPGEVVVGAVVGVDVAGVSSGRTSNAVWVQPRPVWQALTVYRPGAAVDGMEIPALIVPAALGVTVPRLEQPSSAQQRSTSINGRNSLPLIVAADPAGPDDGEMAMEAAIAGEAVVICRRRRRVTARVSPPIVTRPIRRTGISTSKSPCSLPMGTLLQVHDKCPGECSPSNPATRRLGASVV
jgi:hypothetical protein